MANQVPVHSSDGGIELQEALSRATPPTATGLLTTAHSRPDTATNDHDYPSTNQQPASPPTGLLTGSSSTKHSLPSVAATYSRPPVRRCAACLCSEADIPATTTFRPLKAYQLQFFSELVSDTCKGLEANLQTPNITTVFSNLGFNEKESAVCNRCHLSLING